MKFISAFALYILLGISLYAREIPYSVSKQLWDDNLGNHRAVITVGKDADVAAVKIQL